MSGSDDDRTGRLREVVRSTQCFGQTNGMQRHAEIAASDPTARK